MTKIQITRLRQNGEVSAGIRLKKEWQDFTPFLGDKVKTNASTTPHNSNARHIKTSQNITKQEFFRELNKKK